MWLKCLFILILALSAQFRECGKKRQSPIDINKRNCKPCPSDITELEFLHYWDTEGKATVVNTGETIKVVVDCPKDIPTLKGGPLDGCYELDQIHFHWGPHDNLGSEHTINGRAFSMEVHFVHYKKEYKTDEEVENNEDSIAVVAFFVQVGCSVDNELMQNLVNLLCELKDPDNSAEMKAEDVFKIFEEKADNSDYFTYLGSLTTEPYTENVVWIVNPKPILVSHNQIEAFRKIRDAEGRCIEEHFRKVQPLNGRCVFYCSPNAETRCDRSP